MGQVNAPQLHTPMGYDPTTELWLPLKLRPLLTDPVNGEEYSILSVFVENGNPNGQALMVASAPVVVASDQTPIAVKDPVWTMVYSVTQTNVTTWVGSGDITVSLYSQVIINWHISAITSGSIQLFFTRK